MIASVKSAVTRHVCPSKACCVHAIEAVREDCLGDVVVLTSVADSCVRAWDPHNTQTRRNEGIESVYPFALGTGVGGGVTHSDRLSTDRSSPPNDLDVSGQIDIFLICMI